MERDGEGIGTVSHSYTTLIRITLMRDCQRERLISCK